MYIFDTDHLSLIQRQGDTGKQILERVLANQGSKFVVTVITYEEQVRGRLSYLSRAKTIEAQVTAYRQLQKLQSDYSAIEIIAFSRTAILEYKRLKKSYPRLGSMDLRIAAITLTNNATLLTRNISDFGRISEIKIQDWSKP